MQPTFPLTTTIATQSLRGEIDLVPLVFAYMRKQRLFVGNPIVHMTELRAVTKPCITALFCARSFFQHDDFGPGVVGRDGRGLSCITETDDDHVAILWLHKQPPGFSITMNSMPYHETRRMSYRQQRLVSKMKAGY